MSFSLTTEALSRRREEAELRNQIRFRKLRLRGLQRAGEQVLLAATAQNLKRLIRFVIKAKNPRLRWPEQAISIESPGSKHNRSAMKAGNQLVFQQHHIFPKLGFRPVAWDRCRQKKRGRRIDEDGKIQRRFNSAREYHR